LNNSITIRDIAMAAGVSPTTVSYAIRGKKEGVNIPDGTRARIIAIARQSGYKPNRIARDMVLGRQSTIGLILSATGYGESLALIPVIEPILATAGYRLTLVVLPANPTAAQERISTLIHDGVAGILCCPSAMPLTLPLVAGANPVIQIGAGAAESLLRALGVVVETKSVALDPQCLPLSVSAPVPVVAPTIPTGPVIKPIIPIAPVAPPVLPVTHTEPAIRRADPETVSAIAEPDPAIIPPIDTAVMEPRPPLDDYPQGEGYPSRVIDPGPTLVSPAFESPSTPVSPPSVTPPAVEPEPVIPVSEPEPASEPPPVMMPELEPVAAPPAEISPVVTTPPPQTPAPPIIEPTPVTPAPPPQPTPASIPEASPEPVIPPVPLSSAEIPVPPPASIADIDPTEENTAVEDGLGTEVTPADTTPPVAN
jgi:AcrR family transcriptional regulator